MLSRYWRWLEYEIGSDPGLVAFVCTYCGAADSAVVYPKNKTSEMHQSRTQVPADLDG